MVGSLIRHPIHSPAAMYNFKKFPQGENQDPASRAGKGRGEGGGEREKKRE